MKRVHNMKITITYYDRTMCEEMVRNIQTKLDWLIPYVKGHKSLDFQTGHDPKQNRSWFSIYRGTGKIFQVVFRNKEFSYQADKAYKALGQELFTAPTEELFDHYLEKIESDNNFRKYYDGSNGIRKEGYYQTLIGRRYTFDYQEADDFIIIDKEFVLGFKDKQTKKAWNQEIVDYQKKKICSLRSSYKGRLPKEIKEEYGEFDFLGLNKDGDILIMELKQDDPSKTALSPIQIAYYYQQFGKLISEDEQLYVHIKKMIEQKIDMGLISKTFLYFLPERLSGKIIPCIIIGEDHHLSAKICDRYKFVRKEILPEMRTYTCAADGTIHISKKMDE